MRSPSSIFATAMLAVALCLGLMPAAIAQELRAVVAGINDYQSVSHLRGGINDANAVSEALRPIAREIVTLRDAQVTRQALLDAWDRDIAQSRSGDAILVAFSGHGGSEWVGRAVTPRGYREFWVMWDFQPNPSDGPGRTRRISAPDIEARVRSAREKGVNTILLADHCYSGAVYRRLGVDVPSIRQIPTIIAPDAPMPPLPPPASESTLSPPPPGLTSLAASRADTPVSEIKITETGEVHGALSFAFARALTVDRNKVDPTGTGQIRRGALLRYLQGLTVQLADGQEPQLRPLDPPDEVLFRFPPGPAPPHDPMPKRVAVNVSGLPAAEGQALVNALFGAVWVAEPGQARLIWQSDRTPPRLITGQNKFQSFDAPRASLPDAVTAIAAGDALAEQISATGFTVEITDAAGHTRPAHIEGAPVLLRVRGLPGPNLVMFNLTWDGRVQFLYPTRHDAPIAWPSSGLLIDGTTVAPPFGADRVIALASPNGLAPAIQALSRLGDAGRRGEALPEAARRLVEQVLHDDPQAQLAMAGEFSVPMGRRCDPEVIRYRNMQEACAFPPPN